MPGKLTMSSFSNLFPPPPSTRVSLDDFGPRRSSSALSVLWEWRHSSFITGGGRVSTRVEFVVPCDWSSDLEILFSGNDFAIDVFYNPLIDVLFGWAIIFNHFFHFSRHLPLLVLGSWGFLRLRRLRYGWVFLDWVIECYLSLRFLVIGYFVSLYF